MKTKEQITFETNIKICEVYKSNNHTVKDCRYNGNKKHNIDPELVEVKCDGLMHNWRDAKGGEWGCTCELANSSNFAFDNYEKDNKMESVGSD